MKSIFIKITKHCLSLKQCDRAKTEGRPNTENAAITTAVTLRRLSLRRNLRRPPPSLSLSPLLPPFSLQLQSTLQPPHSPLRRRFRSIHHLRSHRRTRLHRPRPTTTTNPISSHQSLLLRSHHLFHSQILQNPSHFHLFNHHRRFHHSLTSTRSFKIRIHLR